MADTDDTVIYPGTLNDEMAAGSTEMTAKRLDTAANKRAYNYATDYLKYQGEDVFNHMLQSTSYPDAYNQAYKDYKESTTEPELEMPTLNLNDEASVVNQTEKLLRYDSLPMQQARMQAKENGTASGEIHSSQQEGAAMRAMTDVAGELGSAEATTAAGEQVYNWQQKATAATTVYNQQYAERLAKLGYDADSAALMATLNSNLSQSLISSTTSLMNNTDLDLEQGSLDKLLDIINAAQDNNNTILGMGFSY
jgi:hypothetical protein